MVTRDDLKEKIEEQLARWKTAIDGLKEKFEQAEVDAKAKLHDQIESLHDRRIKAEMILQDVSAASQDVWEQVKSGAEQGWTELTRTAKSTMGKVRDAIAHPNRDEEIRQIAYHLWRDEGCPDGRHDEHWFKAESIWLARRAQTTESSAQAPAKAKQPRKKSSTSAAGKKAASKPKAVARKKRPDLGEKTS